MDLVDFLAAQMRAPAGAWNCSTLPADWAIERGHPDFAAAWRGVTDPQACEATSEAAGGLVYLWNLGIGDALQAVDRPRAGDIGVVTAHGFEAGAVFTGERWALRTPNRLLFAHPDMITLVKAWRP